ncbi:unnamed protein product [Prunus brigantina]
MNQFSAQLKVLRSDNGTEFMNSNLSQYLSSYGVIHQTSCVGTPQQNGVAERKNRDLLEKTRSLMLQMNVPKKFWSQGVLTAAYVINRLPSRVLDYKSPLEVLKGRKIDLSHLRIFGCVCFVHIQGLHRDKFDSRAAKCFFMGYSSTQKGYKCYDSRTRKIIISRDVVFDETCSFFDKSYGNNSQGESFLDQVPLPIVETIDDHSPTSVPCSGDITSSSEGTPSNNEVERYITYANVSRSHAAFLSKISNSCEPSSFQEAKTQLIWQKAMREELKALDENQTWSIVKLPKGKKVVGCRWVYKTKFNSDGSIERHKARLVAKGFTQTFGVDYKETFAPVAKMNTVRVLLSVAVNNDWPLFQMDVKNAFLHGELEEEVYMSLPPGHPQEKQEGMVCKLHKAIYGLKQSPRAWYAKLRSLKYFLGIEIASSSKGLFLNQRKYVLDLLQETGMLETKPVITPIDCKAKLGLDGDLLADASSYQRLVGRLIYLTITRPDISHAVSLVSQFMHSPRSTHLQAVKRILRYLKGSIGRGILMRKNGNNQIIGYSDADWAGCKIDRKSTTGYCTFVGGNLVTWKSKKQSGLLNDLGFKDPHPMTLFCDNQAAIHIASNPVFHERTKHIEVDCHFVREKIQSNIIRTSYIRSNEQLADIFTKGLPLAQFENLLFKLVSINILASA